MVKSEDIPKPGKQRLGPRKKKLSTLKKRILLDRLDRWKTLQREGVPALPPAIAEEEDRQEEESACLPSSSFPPGASSSSLLSSALARCGDDIGEVGGGSSSSGEWRLWIITVHNLVDEQDVEDDDDHAEVERDLWEMASTYGVVRSIEVPRSAAQSNDATTGAAAPSSSAAVAAKVAFATIDEAQCAREGFHGRIVGGKALQVEIGEDVNSGDSTPPSKSRHRPAPAPAGSSQWRVAVEHLIDEEDDLDDEDEYAEVCADVSAMMGVYGHLRAVDIPRRRRKNDQETHNDDDTTDGETATAMEAAAGQVVVVTFGSLTEAEACVEGTKGRLVGGKALDAKVLPGPAAEREHDERRGCTSAIGTTAAEPPSSPPGGNNTASNAKAVGGRRSKWRVVIRNLIDEEDLDDDDDYGEVRADVTTLASAFGAVTGLYVPRNRKEEGVATEEADSHGDDRAELGEAVAVYGSLEEAEACARGLSGRKIGGKILDAQVLTKNSVQLSRQGRGPPGEETRRGARPGQGGPSQSEGPFDAVPELHYSRLGLLQEIGSSDGAGNQGDEKIEIAAKVSQESPGATAAATMAMEQPSGGATLLPSTEKGKRVPIKYKEAAALPKPPGVNGGVPPNAYVNQVRLRTVLVPTSYVAVWW